MPANVIAVPLTNTQILFVDLPSANTFFGSFTVPDATLANFGCVKAAGIVSFVPTSVVGPTYSTLGIVQGDGSVVNVNVVTDTDYGNMVTAVTQLQAALNTLINNLANAGVLK